MSAFLTPAPYIYCRQRGESIKPTICKKRQFDLPLRSLRYERGRLHRMRRKESEYSIIRLGHRVCLLALAMIALGGCIAEEEPTEEVVVVGSTLPDFEVTTSRVTQSAL